MEKRPLPTEPGPYDVVVAPKKTGLCGSDMHIFLDGRAGESTFDSPLILGHESAGIIAKGK
ncbi:hypothetical protein ACHAPJ_003143 [Fusarium lateritium]